MRNNHLSLVRFQRGSTSARMLLMVLCLATWRGPIPWVHAHGSEDVADEQLERHLLSYHRGHLNERFFSWHLHLMLPWIHLDQDCDSDSQQQMPDPLTKNGALSLALNSGELVASLTSAALENLHCDQSLPELLWSKATQRQQLHAFSFGSFLESLRLNVPLCAVTGVALC